MIAPPPRAPEVASVAAPAVAPAEPAPPVAAPDVIARVIASGQDVFTPAVAPAAPAPDVIARVVASGQNVFTPLPETVAATPDAIARVIQSGADVFVPLPETVPGAPDVIARVLASGQDVFTRPDVIEALIPTEPPDRTLAGMRVLTGETFVTYVRNRCQAHDVDPLGDFANMLYEGIHGQIGDDGHAFGPNQMNNAGGVLTGKFPGWTNEQINTWAWTANGIEYAIAGMAKAGARGVRGRDSAKVICLNWERPANKEAKAEVRAEAYDALAAQGEKVWAGLAGLAKGPASGASTGPATSAVVTPATGPNGAWRELMRLLGSGLPNTGSNAANVARRLKGVVS